MPKTPPTAKPEAPKPMLRIGKLTTPMEVAAELARLYKAGRRGDLDSLEASRLAAILDMLRRALTDAQLEKRIDELEKLLPTADVIPMRRAQ